MSLRFLSVYAGIGAHDLGFQSAGVRIIGQCELDPFCAAVLEKHWPGLPRWSDVRNVTAQLVRAACGAIDGITGGFSCQDLSVAGRGAGLGRETRSGLTWRNLFRLIRGLRPRWIVIENVPALLSRGYDRVAAALERIGYTLWPVVVGAWAIGAPHRRNRVWIVGRLADAYRNAVREQRECARGSGSAQAVASEDDCRGMADAASCRLPAGTGLRFDGEPRGRRKSIGADKDLAHAASRGLRTDRGAQRDAGHADECGPMLADSARHGQRCESTGERANGQRIGQCSDKHLADATEPRLQGQRSVAGQSQGPESWDGLPSAWPSWPGEPQHEWEAPQLIEFPVGRTTDGTSGRLVRFANRNSLKALGNCNPPHVAYLIGQWIIGQEREVEAA